MPKPRRATLCRSSCLLPAALAALLGAPAQAQVAADPAAWPHLPGNVLIQPRIEAFIRTTLRHMTLEAKIGQMVQADIGSIQPSDLRRYKLGSVLAGGFAAPGNDVHASAQTWRSMVASYKSAAVSGGPGNAPQIPLIFGIDAVHGDAKIRGATIFPHNVGLGAAHDPALLQRIGAATAEEVRATGVDWVFAPTVAVARDVRWGRSFESYSDDPALVASYAGSMVSGLQGKLGSRQFLDASHVLSSAKHFLGDGGTANGRDQGDTLASEAILRDVHAPGYEAAIEAGVATVMASYSSWQGTKMHANASLLTGVLKQRWGFDGFVVGDWNAQEEIPGCTKFSCARMINAGVDMVMAPDGWRDLYANLLTQARNGTITAARIDDAVTRILRVKALAGLIGPIAAHGAAPGLNVIGSAQHRALARQAVRESLVLLKNERELLPLARHQRVLVAGPGADAIGQQCGGWTVDWQGASNSNADLPGATSIFAGIRQAVQAGGGTATLSEDGSYTTKPDVAIVVFGEQPYAEFEGDRETLVPPQAAQDRLLLKHLHDAGIPVVAVLLSGRPLWVNPELNLSDAFVAAWLPGSEGEGVADMLFRGPDGAARAFTGRLSFPWPATALPVAYAADGTAGHALFDRGYGLATAQPAHLAYLSEDPNIPPGLEPRESFFAEGHVVAPWSIYVNDPVAELRMTLPAASSPGGGVDTALIPDGVALHWSGHALAAWRIGGRPENLADPGPQQPAISLRYRVDRPPTAPMQMGLLCGPQCGAWIDVSRAMAAEPPAAGAGWRQLDVPLACFARRGAHLQEVETPFALRTAGQATITIRSVQLSRTALAAPCP